ncbi:MAG: hypothetical protein LRY51_06590 [Geovibrio sp.]|nr:hypothetical protein [Geovibrio sp.]
MAVFIIVRKNLHPCSFYSLAACGAKLLAALVTFAFLAYAAVRTPRAHPCAC